MKRNVPSRLTKQGPRTTLNEAREQHHKQLLFSVFFSIRYFVNQNFPSFYNNEYFDDCATRIKMCDACSFQVNCSFYSQRYIAENVTCRTVTGTCSISTFSCCPYTQCIYHHRLIQFITSSNSLSPIDKRRIFFI